MKIQKKIIRLIVFAEYKEHTTPLFIRLSMLQLCTYQCQARGGGGVGHRCDLI